MSAQTRIYGTMGRYKQFDLLTFILTLAILLRLGVAFYKGDQVPPPPMAPDDTSYSYLAERLVTGHGYSFDQPWYPFGKPAGEPTAHWSFLYAAFLAGVYSIFGVHPLAARLIGAILGGLLLPLLVHRLTGRLFPGQERLALIAAACAAFYAYFVLYAARLMTETFFIVALLWMLERALALAERPTLIRGVILGLGLGISVLLRQSVLPWIMLLCIWLLWTGWRTEKLGPMLRALAVAGVLLLLAILPFTIRNYVVYGDFLLLNSNAGYAMYSAQHPMHGYNFQEHTAAPMPAELHDLNEAELDRALMRRGIQFVLAEPGRYLLLSLSRVWDYFEFWPTAESSLLNNVGRVTSFGLFLPFMLYGLWLAIRRVWPLPSLADWVRFSTTPLAVVLLFMLSYSLLHIFTWAMPRYRLPVDAVALPFVALALVEGLIPAISSRFARHKITIPRI